MITTCPSTTSGASLARDALASVDCVIGGQVETGYAALLAPGGAFSSALTLALTIYVAIIGYRLILGQAGLTLGELVPHFVKIGLVLALVTNWPAYQSLVFDVLFHGPEQLADSLTGHAAGLGTGHAGILDGLQILFDRLTDYAGNAWSQHTATTVTTTPTPPVTTPTPPTSPTPPPGAPNLAPGLATPTPAPAAGGATLPFTLGAPQFVAALLWFGAVVMMAASVGVLLVVRIILALLLLIGPAFLAMALFAPSRGLALGWLRTTIKFALVPLFTLPLTAAMLAVAGPLAADLGQGLITSVRDGPALFIVLVILVFAAVMWQAARLGGGIASGLRWPRFTPAAPALPASAAVPGAARETVFVAGSSRAEAIVQSIDSGARRITIGGGAAAPGLASVRALSVGGSAAPTESIAAAGLGQSYRRLAIASAAPRRLPS